MTTAAIVALVLDVLIEVLRAVRERNLKNKEVK